MPDGKKLTISIDEDGRVTLSNAEFERSVADELAKTTSGEEILDHTNIWKCS